MKNNLEMNNIHSTKTKLNNIDVFVFSRNKLKTTNYNKILFDPSDYNLIASEDRTIVLALDKQFDRDELYVVLKETIHTEEHVQIMMNDLMNNKK